MTYDALVVEEFPQVVLQVVVVSSALLAIAALFLVLFWRALSGEMEERTWQRKSVVRLIMLSAVVFSTCLVLLLVTFR
ncbi:MAG TPA: hypothetical protein VMT00_05750 [Thermoanaerobaculia bacterium]|nr:hypothetical protein [Thermoanaerobaculia bacterium]